MQKMTRDDVIKAYIKTLGTPCVWVGGFDPYPDGANGSTDHYGEILKAVPYLEEHEVEIICEGFVLVVCENMDEAMSVFKQTVGDDGPTELNDYDGPVRAYACVYDEEGNPYTENT